MMFLVDTSITHEAAKESYIAGHFRLNSLPDYCGKGETDCCTIFTKMYVPVLMF